MLLKIFFLLFINVFLNEQKDIKAKYEGGVLRLSVPKSDMKQIENTSTISIE